MMRSAPDPLDDGAVGDLQPRAVRIFEPARAQAQQVQDRGVDVRHVAAGLGGVEARFNRGRMHLSDAGGSSFQVLHAFHMGVRIPGSLAFRGLE